MWVVPMFLQAGSRLSELWGRHATRGIWKSHVRKMAAAHPCCLQPIPSPVAKLNNSHRSHIGHSSRIILGLTMDRMLCYMNTFINIFGGCDMELFLPVRSTPQVHYPQTAGEPAAGYSW